jgi:hypothetical protein
LYIIACQKKKKKKVEGRKIYALNVIFLRIRKTPTLVNFSGGTAESIRVT